MNGELAVVADTAGRGVVVGSSHSGSEPASTETERKLVDMPKEGGPFFNEPGAGLRLVRELPARS